MVPDNDVGRLTQPDPSGVGCDRGLHHERVRTHFRAFGLEVVLCQPERLKAQFLRQDALAHLVHESRLRRPMHLCQRAVIQSDGVFGGDDRQVGRTVVEHADFQHGCFAPYACRTGTP